MECEMPVSFLECMPLYKWQYCHELLCKDDGYCDLVFQEFLEELNEHLLTLPRLIKLDCLDKEERKMLISLFKCIIKKGVLFPDTTREKEFLEAVEQLKTNK